MNKKEILKNVDKLVTMYKKGLLDGEVMPENNQYWLELTEKQKFKVNITCLHYIKITLQKCKVIFMWFMV